MEAQENPRKRRSYRWSKVARTLVEEFLSDTLNLASKDKLRAQRVVVRKLVEMTGNPRYACTRFVHQCQAVPRTPQVWSPEDKQKLMDMASLHPVPEIARILNRSQSSVRTMLSRLGGTAKMGRNWFTKYTLAKVLGVGAPTVQRWVDKGWLKQRTLQSGDFTKPIIEGQDFADFCKAHRDEIVCRRLSSSRLDFVRNYVFPPNPADVLAVRDAQREEAEFQNQIGKQKLGPRSERGQTDENALIA